VIAFGRHSAVACCRQSTRQAPVAYQLANVQPPDLQIVYGQRADTSAFHGKRANGDTSDRERTYRRGAERERAECDRTKTEGPIDARRPMVFCRVASRRLNRSESFLAKLHVVHGVSRSSMMNFDLHLKRSEGPIDEARSTRCRPISSSDSHCYDPAMRPRDATDMLAGSGIAPLGPTVWADLGCGDGAFTLALAEVLASDSVIHAMDLDGSVLRRIPSAHNHVRITRHRGDFTNVPWPFADLDGILMANSLHYVENQAAFIRACKPQMKPRGRFLIVEYDTTEASRWVPYPINRAKLTALFEREGYSSRVLRSRPSIYRRAPLYVAAIERS
jgi:2-polyprenyl-3-methyl-5-hydroxy-6-metoxy-1,4-benzoquinol methylase